MMGLKLYFFCDSILPIVYECNDIKNVKEYKFKIIFRGIYVWSIIYRHLPYYRHYRLCILWIVYFLHVSLQIFFNFQSVFTVTNWHCVLIYQLVSANAIYVKHFVYYIFGPICFFFLNFHHNMQNFQNFDFAHIFKISFIFAAKCPKPLPIH